MKRILYPHNQEAPQGDLTYPKLSIDYAKLAIEIVRRLMLPHHSISLSSPFRMLQARLEVISGVSKFAYQKLI
ncbi:hypothetical protein ccbrp13_63850 [Ktedonobacteria bacterium brp13]|nr:hypothetical protein ccbrp13_63850 [Ktedonobacteria bacterium brp13]